MDVEWATLEILSSREEGSPESFEVAVDRGDSVFSDLTVSSGVSMVMMGVALAMGVISMVGVASMGGSGCLGCDWVLVTMMGADLLLGTCG